jgi:hypothetical protein
MANKLFLLFAMFLITVTVTSQSTSSLRSDGTILVNGQPFFPFGAHSVHWSNSAADRMAGLKAMINAGFNVSTQEYTQSGSGANFGDLVDTACHYGIYLSIGVPSPPNLPNAINAYKNRNCVLWWALADDGDDGSPTITELTTYNSNAKSADNTRLTYLTLTGFDTDRRNNVSSYTPIADVAALQIYPIGTHVNYDVTTTNALTQTYLRTLAYVQSATALNKPMIMNLQTFNWGSQSNIPRYPTVAELRNMMYSGLAAGVKGIISYDFSFDLMNNQTALWNEFKTLRTDVTTLQQALMNGALTRVNTGDQELVSSYWIYNNKCYVVVVNTSYSNAKNVAIQLPPGYRANIPISLFPRIAGVLNSNSGILNGTVAPEGVQVYSIDYSPPSDTIAPSVPSGLFISSVAQTTFTLNWNASTDNVGVVGYEIYRDGVLIGTTSSTSFSLTGLTCNTSYVMHLKAFDAEENFSIISATASGTTTSCNAQGSNLLINSGFENGVIGWLGKGCNITPVTSPKRTGVNAVSATSRTSPSSGPYQDVRIALINNGVGSYYVEAYVRTANGNSNAKITVALQYGGNNYYISTPSIGISKNKWTKISGTLTLNWIGVLAEAGLYVETNSGTNSIYVDDCILQKNYSSGSKIHTTFPIRETLPLQKNIYIYPNPVHSKLNIQGLSENYIIRIFTSDGKTVFSGANQGNLSIIIDVSRWKKGIYIAEFTSKAKRFVNKIIVN